MNDLKLILDFFGISLNFVAGLLLTPEAVGKERISRAEKFMRHSLVRIIMKLDSTKSKITKVEKDIRLVNVPKFISSAKIRLGIPF